MALPTTQTDHVQTKPNQKSMFRQRRRKQPETPQTQTDADFCSMSVEERLDYLQTEIDGLKERNVKKDRGKEFEGSYTRILFLMAITYWTLFAYMALVLKTNNPFLDAIVPTVGFNISTWSLPYVKEWWIQARHYYMYGETEATTNQRSSTFPSGSERESQDEEQAQADEEEGKQ